MIKQTNFITKCSQNAYKFIKSWFNLIELSKIKKI